MYKYDRLEYFCTLSTLSYKRFKDLEKSLPKDKMNRLALLFLCMAAANASHRRSDSAPEPQASEGALITVPEYTTILSKIDNAVTQVKSSLGPNNNLNGQFVMLANAVSDLMNLARNEFTYFDLYYGTIDAAILKALKYPQQAANSVKTQIDKILSKITEIREVINNKQNTVCKQKISYQCDLIIDIAIRTSTDDLLKTQAHLIQTVGAEVDSYVGDYAKEFEAVAKSNDAESYLINGIQRLWPLARLGAETRKQAESVLPSRRFNSVTIEFDDYDNYE